MRQIVIASHHRFAEGLRSTLEFVLGPQNIITICAYTDDTPLADEVERIFSSFSRQDEVLVLTDMMQGSVNQELSQRAGEHVHVIAGVNVPLALELAVESRPLTAEVIDEAMSRARKQIVYVNGLEAAADDDDE